MNKRCDCERGGPCTRTVLCAVNSVQDELEAAQKEMEELRSSLLELSLLACVAGVPPSIVLTILKADVSVEKLN